jgi:fucose 4-O-acetylase-like acetyltransferase
MKQRDVFVDIAKGVCMLLVICIHTEVFGVIGMPLTFIAVPMFFFMSGFYDRTEKPIREWIGKSVRRLLIPAIVWVFIGNLYLRLLGYVKNGIIEPYVFDYLNPQIGNGPAWFLVALFYAKIFMCLIGRVNLSKCILFLCCLGVGYIGATYEMPLLIDEGMAALPLYYIGKLIYPYLGKIIGKWWINIIGIIILVVFMTTEYYYNVAPVNGLYNPNYLFAIVGAMFVFIPILKVSDLLKNVKPLMCIGEKSMEIMLIHTLICHTFAVIFKRILVEGSAIWIGCSLISYWIIVFLAYYIGVFIKKYIPFLF